MIHLLPEDPPLMVGILPQFLKLPCRRGSHAVLLSHHTFEHIRARRENEHPFHLSLVLSRLETVIADPSHYGCLSREPHKLDIWAWNPSDFCGVLVSLKCLPGETWVNTAFPLGTKTLRKHVLRDKLRALRGA